jgi:hypothetical protein
MPDFSSETKSTARMEGLIRPYRELTGLSSVPDDLEVWSLSDEQNPYKSGAVTEVAQLLGEGFCKQHQYRGFCPDVWSVDRSRYFYPKAHFHADLIDNAAAPLLDRQVYPDVVFLDYCSWGDAFDLHTYNEDGRITGCGNVSAYYRDWRYSSLNWVLFGLTQSEGTLPSLVAVNISTDGGRGSSSRHSAKQLTEMLQRDATPWGFKRATVGGKRSYAYRSRRATMTTFWLVPSVKRGEV